MSEVAFTDNHYKVLIPPRPVTRTSEHRKQYVALSNNNINQQRAHTARKSELPTNASTHINNLQNHQYLHIRLLKKQNIKNIQQNALKAFELKTKPEELEEPQFFIRKKKGKAISIAKTDQVIRCNNQPRPSTSQASDKIAYFDDVCSNNQALKAYKVISHIGKGAFSIVSQAIGRENNCKYAIKAYEKLQALDWNRLAYIKRQINHLKKLQNKRVIKLVETVRERKKLYLILQNGGKQSLCGLLRKQKTINEPECRRLFKQILEGISYCHQHGVCHRDLKPENILIDEQDNIKIIDFGFSANSKIMLTNFCGTPAYMSPEIVKKQPYNGTKADIWALGVMLYLMVVGSLPFRATHEQELYRLISTGKYRYRQQNGIPQGAKKMIAKMLQVNPQTRPEAKDLLSDIWMQ